MDRPSATGRQEILHSFIIIIVIALALGAANLRASHAQAAASDVLPQQAAFTLDGVDLSVQASALPSGSFTAAEPGSASQVASSASWKPFRELTVTAIPFGTSAGSESLPAAAAGSAASYREALRIYRAAQGGAVSDGPVATLFGQPVRAVHSLVWINVDGPELKPVAVDEWVVEAGGRLWIVRASQEQSSTDLSGLGETGVAELRLSSGMVDRPTTVTDDLSLAGAQGESVGAAVLATPSWWHGDCDTDTYSAGAGGRAAYRLGEVYQGMPACGPRPWSDGAPDVLVRFFTGAWGSYEWECVELSMRFLYLMYGINPYQGNGSQVVWNYSGSRLLKIANSTPGKAPQPNDVLSYGATTTAGHTSVVTSSTVDVNGNGTITVIEQNAAVSGKSTLTVTNWTVQGNSSSVSGWLHDPTNDPTATPTPTSTVTSTPDGSSTPTPTATDTSGVTATPTSAATATPTATRTPSPTPTATVVRYTISGYAGAPGVKLKYVDGVTRTAISDSAGNYSLAVPHGWSGAVTPSLSGATFTPSRRSFSNVISGQAGQDFQALITKTFKSSGAQDGWILEAGEDSETGGTLNSVGTAIRVGDFGTDGQYRSILVFDTSSLPDGAVITKVTLKIRRSGTAGTNPFITHGELYVDLRTGSFGDDPALQLGDFAASGSLSPAGSIPNTPVSNWYSKVWTSGIMDYINMAGLTELRLRFALDDNDDLGNDYLKFHSGNSGTSSYRPQLIIQYYVP